MSATPGYTGKLVRVDLSTGVVSHIPTEKYAEDLLGGRGIATKVYWDEVPPQVGAFDPENRLVFATGPFCGVVGLAGSRWLVCGKSPASTPEFFNYSNLGGAWGAALKSAGYDGLVVQGQADKPVYLIIEDGHVEIRDASGLWGKGCVQVREILKGELGASFRVAGIGPAGESRVTMATVLADNDSCGSAGLGAVMGSKNLKAIAVRGQGKVEPAHPGRFQELLDRVAQLQKDAPRTGEPATSGPNFVKDHCFGCTDTCMRGVYQAKDGQRGKWMCQSGHFYSGLAKSYYKESNEVPFYANRLCDEYGLNTKSIDSVVSWLQACHRAGLLNEKGTGLPLTKIGSLEFMQALVASISQRRGFGDVLAQGLARAAETVGQEAVDLVGEEVTKAGDKQSYGPKVYITTGLLYALEIRQPIQQLHEVSRLAIQWSQWARGMPGAHVSSDVIRAIAKRFWGGELAADFSTYEGKALAAKLIQERQLAKECLVLCDLTWPILYVEHSSDHLGDPDLESELLYAVTGRKLTTEELYRIGERVVNLQRAILVCEGHHGRESDTLPEACFTVPLDSERLNPDCLLPGKDGETISRKGAVVDRATFQRTLGEYYELRGWDQRTGLQRKAPLAGLRLGDVAQDLEARGLLASP